MGDGTPGTSGDQQTRTPEFATSNLSTTDSLCSPRLTSRKMSWYEWHCALQAPAGSREGPSPLLSTIRMHVQIPCCLIANLRLKHGGLYDVAAVA